MTPVPSNPPPFPALLDGLVAPGAVVALAPVELGAVYRLLASAWGLGCVLPPDAVALATIAGMGLDEFRAMQPRLVWALGLRWNPSRSGAVCSHAAGVFASQSARVSSLSTARSEAGRAGNAKRWGNRQPPSQTVANRRKCDAIAIAGDSARSLNSALERSDLDLNQERSSASAPGVIATIHAGIDATASARMTDWRVQRSLDLLRAAARRWTQEGRRRGKPVDDGDLIRIAQDGRVRPALVQIALAREAEAHSDNPLGYVIAALGVRRGGAELTPYLSDQAVVDRWAAIEEKQVGAERAKSAITGFAARIDAKAAAVEAQARKSGGAS